MKTADNRKKRILVVDDDSLTREMVGSILASSGFDVSVARGGREGLETLLDDSGIDLVISDMNMPELSGLDFIKVARQKGLDAPFIFLTGNETISVAIEALKNGAVDYLLKDEHIGELLAISANHAIENNRLRKNNEVLLRQLERQNKELERLALLDPLTGIPNRRYLQEMFEREWKNATRAKAPLSVIMMDIDFFKLFNDTYGHYKGDECLIMVAKALSEALLRPTDFVARYGGEEFVAILPDTAEDGAVIVAEKLRTSVEQLRIPHAKSTVLGYVTLSLGVGGFSPASEAPLSETVTLVDKALYEAKHKGRNRVCRLALMKEPH